MPNWCNNHLYVYGTREDAAAFKQRAVGKNSALSLNNFVPMPEELRLSGAYGDDLSGNMNPAHRVEQEYYRARYDFPDWYEWCLHHWGVKWDISEGGVTDLGSPPGVPTRRALHYHFESPWSGPFEALRRMSAQFPNLLFALHYFEEFGADLPGWWVCVNGEDTMLPIDTLIVRGCACSLKALERLWHDRQTQTATSREAAVATH